MSQGFAKGSAASISITGDSGGTLSGSSFTLTGGATGLTFAGSGSTETLGGTLALANGGTNATSMATSTGIVKYDGTRLVTSSTAKLDSSNRMTNSSQPAFSVYPSGTLTDKTGDSTDYSIVFDTAFINVGTCVNLTTGVFTAPVTGNYFLCLQIFLLQLGAAHTFAEPYLQLAGSLSYNIQGCYNPGAMRATSSNTNDLTLLVQGFQTLAANDTVTPHIIVGGSTKTVDLNGGTSGGTFFYGWLVS